MDKRLIQISAFFKNDKPGGIGISIDMDFGNLDEMLFILQASYNAMWAECQENGSLPDLNIPYLCHENMLAKLDD